MATFSSMIETEVGSTIYDPESRGMVAGPSFTRRHYVISACERDFNVQSVYAEGDYDLVVNVIGGRGFRVGTDETPTIDAAVASAIKMADRTGMSISISEEVTAAAHWAAIDRADAKNASDFPLATMPR